MSDRGPTTGAAALPSGSVAALDAVVLAPHRPDHLLVVRALERLDLSHRAATSAYEAAAIVADSPATVVVLRGPTDLLVGLRDLAPAVGVVAVAENPTHGLELRAAGADDILAAHDLGPLGLEAALKRVATHRPGHLPGGLTATVPGDDALLGLFAQNGTEVAMAVDGTDRICWISPNSERLLGVGPAELIGRPALDLVHPDDLDALVLGLLDLVEVGDSMDIELRAIDLDGVEHWIEGTVRRLSGRPPTGSVFVTMRDITERRASRQSLEFQANLLAAVGQAVVAMDAEGRVTYLNPAAERLSGWSYDEIVGLDGGSRVVARRSGDGEALVRAQILSGQPWSGELWMTRRDGSEFLGRVDNTPLIAEDGTAVGLIAVVTDLTDHLQLVAAAQEERDRLAAAQRGAGLGSFDLDTTTNQVVYSDQLYTILGLPVGSAVDVGTYAALVHPDDLPSLEASANRAMAGDRETWHVHRILRPDGEMRWVEVRNSTPEHAPNRLCGTVLDITERQRVAQQMDHDMRHDALTGLPNRAEVTQRLGALLAAQAHGGAAAAVAFVDLDRFKVINDGLGHSVGDQVLVEVAARLREASSPTSIVARFGGDEFVVVERAPGSHLEALDMVRSMVASLEKPIQVGPREFVLTASVGVATSAATNSPSDLLQAADMAMHAAKELPGTQVVHFDDALQARSERELRIETDLRRALERCQLEVYYQPIVTIPDGRWVGFESLLRWHHPELGPISPEEFIPIAEATGVIVPIGRWVLDRALEQLDEWHSIPGWGHLWTAVNLSGTQLASDNIARTVADALTSSGVRPSDLHVEITESVLMERIDGSLETLHELRRLGVHLSVDDFGTGYSSLSYLKRLPVQILKVDRAFTSGLGVDVHDTSIVRAISRLAEELGLSLLAEGVETEEQLRALDELGCGLAQGYLWSAPVNAETITGFLSAHEDRNGPSPRGAHVSR